MCYWRMANYSDRAGSSGAYGQFEAMDGRADQRRKRATAGVKMNQWVAAAQEEHLAEQLAKPAERTPGKSSVGGPALGVLVFVKLVPDNERDLFP